MNNSVYSTGGLFIKNENLPKNTNTVFGSGMKCWEVIIQEGDRWSLVPYQRPMVWYNTKIWLTKHWSRDHFHWLATPLCRCFFSNVWRSTPPPWCTLFAQHWFGQLTRLCGKYSKQGWPNLHWFHLGESALVKVMAGEAEHDFYNHDAFTRWTCITSNTYPITLHFTNSHNNGMSMFVNKTVAI